MNLLNHPHAKATSIEIDAALDGTVRNVLVVDTDLPLCDVEAGYDADAVLDLIKSVQAFIRDTTGLHRARIQCATSDKG